MYRLSTQILIMIILSFITYNLYAQTSPSKVYSIAYNSQNHLFIGTHEEGLLGSFDGGDSWHSLNSGMSFLPTYSVFIDSNDHLLRGGLGIFRSLDNGNTWTMVQQTFHVVWSFAQNPNGLIVSGTEFAGIHGSYDAGATWQELGSFSFLAQTIASDINNNIFVGTQYSGLFHSTDLGANWVFSGFANQEIYDIKLKNNSDILAGSEAGLYHSSDNGSSWSLLNFQGENVRAIFLDSNDNIFSGIDSVLYFSNDGGNNWVEIGNFTTRITSVVYTPNNNILVGTFNSGLFISSDAGQSWRSAWSIVGIKNQNENGLSSPDQYELFQNYPNPFNPSTTISYLLPKTSMVSLTVFNVTGQNVRTLVNQISPPGYQSVLWDGKDNNGKSIPTGIYFYKLKTDNFSKVNKMILAQ